jgi:DNA polymerase III epsilon subunit-like protein
VVNTPKPRQPRKSPLWLPYLQSVKESRKGIFDFVFNGGEITVPINEVASIMIYGDSDTPLDTRILAKITGAGVPVVLHRRNVARSVFISAGPRADPDDTLSAHLIRRSQSRVSTHIARQLLLAKMDSMKYLTDPLPVLPYTPIDKLRNIEAVHAKAYWDAWFARLGHPGWHRRDDNPAAATLDAVSKFLSGITLRWITYHNLSPYHGFLHTPTDYPTLVYDLLEPYRGLTDAVTLRTLLTVPEQKLWIPRAIADIKGWLNTQTYVPLTRQIVSNQELLHGAVLSLKYYLLGRQRKFHVPLPGKPKGGRPAKVEFMLYGRHAGKTDFWKVAKQVSEQPYEPGESTNTAPLPENEAASAQVAAKVATHKPGRAAHKTTNPRNRTPKIPILPYDYVVIDIETTGLVADHDSIIELAALRVRSGKITASYGQLVKSPAPLNETIRELTGLSDEILMQEGIGIRDALRGFLAFVGSEHLVGHSIGFDLRFINQACYREGMALLTQPTTDTQTLARKLIPGRTTYKLGDLAAEAKIHVPQAHRALADCHTAHQLLEWLRQPQPDTATVPSTSTTDDRP